MSRDIGVDLTGPCWCVAKGRFEGTGRADPVRFEEPIAVIPRDWGDRSLWEATRPLLALDSGTPVAELRAERPKYALAPDQSLKALDRTSRIALAFPARTPPLLRRWLPWLVGLHHDDARHKLPEDVFGVEAPIAIALEAIAQRRVSAPPPAAHLLTLSSAGDRHELAALSIEEGEPGERSLSIHVEGIVDWPIAEGSPPPPACLSAARAWVAAQPDRWQLALAGDALRPEALVVLDAVGLQRVQAFALDHQAIAQGAVRFAGLRGAAGASKTYLGNKFSRVAISAISPAPLGVLGVVHDQWCWHQLLPAQSSLSLPTGPAIVGSNGPGPEPGDPIVFAECTAAPYVNQTWIAHQDWRQAGLVWHDTEKVTQVYDKKVLPEFTSEWSFVVRTKPRDEHWCTPRWSVTMYRPPRSR